jgi:hypothetical protein
MPRNRLLVVALAVVSLWSAAPSFAARPAAAGRYLWNGPTNGYRSEGVLQFSPGERRITSEGWESGEFFDYYGSYLTIDVECEDVGDALDFKFGGPAGQRVLVSASGTFRASLRSTGSGGSTSAGGPTGTGHITVRGRVLNRTQVLVMLRGQWGPTEQPEACAIPPQRLVFHLQREPRFADCAHHPGHTLLTTKAGFVYRARGEDEYRSSPWAYACLVGGRQIALGPLTDEATIELTMYDFRLTGTEVRYTQATPIEFAPTAIHVLTVDLRGYGRLVSDKWR